MDNSQTTCENRTLTHSLGSGESHGELPSSPGADGLHQGTLIPPLCPGQTFPALRLPLRLCLTQGTVLSPSLDEL